MVESNCQCTGPGYCSLLQRDMSEVRWNECKHKPKYFEMFLKVAGKPRTTGSVKPYKTASLGTGPGTELHGMLSRLGMKFSKDCKCNAHIREMNKQGIEWCEENVETIVGWLRDEAARRKIPFVDLIARKFIRMATKRAKKKAYPIRT